jgi:hypothetical protein
MKGPITYLLFLAFAVQGEAQIHIDRPLVLTSPDSAQRQISGLGAASEGTSLIRLVDAQAGVHQWAQVGGTASAIALVMDPPCTAYTNGLMVRFVPAASAAGTLTFNVDGLGARPVYRSDGLRPILGQVQLGRMVEAIYADSAFFLQGRAAAACPEGYLQANASVCLMRNDSLNMSVYNANNWCMSRGARLCNWDEYISACTTLQGQLEGMFDDWEWVDGTADHTHTAVQAGRYSCRTERSWGALENNNNYARVRCCYSLR